MIRDELTRSAATNMVQQLEATVKSALDKELPGGWTLLDVKHRCRFVRIHGSPWETFYLDGKALFDIGPIESSQEIVGDSYIIKYTRQVRAAQ